MTSTTARPVLLLVGTLLAMGLARGQGRAATIHVPGDAPTIQAGVNLALPGDDVLVADGVYVEHDIIIRGGIWVHTEAGPAATEIDAGGSGAVLVCSDLTDVAVIQGFTLRNGSSDRNGGGVQCIRSRLTIRDCVVVGCSTNFGLGGGISAEDSILEVESCKISGCYAYGGGGGIAGWPSAVKISGCEIRDNVAGRGGGLAVFGSQVTILASRIDRNVAEYGSAGGILISSPALVIRDCLIVNNVVVDLGGPSGLHVISSLGTISGCTVAANRKWFEGDPAVGLEDSNIEIDRMIVAFNEGRGLDCYYGIESHVTVHCSNAYGNTDGNAMCGQDLGGSLSSDPLFCDAANGDYTLDWASPCLPGDHPNGVDCGLIGALGAGCGTPPVMGACCFADDSCVVTEREDCASQGGTYLGDDTDCDPNPCVPTTTEKTTWGRIRAGYR